MNQGWQVMIPIDGNVGPYRVLATLGEGGMGSVVRARACPADCDVAVKILVAEQKASNELKLAAERLRDKALAAQV